MSAAHDGISISISRSWHFVRYKIVDDVVEMLMKKRERKREREGERVLVAEVSRSGETHGLALRRSDERQPQT